MKNELICLGHKIKALNPSGDFDMVEGTTYPHVPGPPPHFHTGYFESFYVLEGSMEFMVNGEFVFLEKGDTIDLPPHTPHTFKTIGEQPSRWLNIHSPKGFLSFFNEFGVDANQQNAFEKSVDPTLISAVIDQAARFDMHLVRP